MTFWQSTVFLLSLLVSLGLALLYWIRGWNSGRATARSIVDWVRSGMSGLGRAGAASTDGSGLL